MNVTPSWMTARNRAGCGVSSLDAAGAGAPLLHELLDPGAADRDERRLSGDEDGVEQDQDRDDEDLEQPVHRAASSSSGRTRGSRMRAGTPTASLPGGTSRVTTAPAPVFAPSPTSTGATSIVSTPTNARSPIRVRCLRRPS